MYNGGGKPLAKHLNRVVLDVTAEVFDGSSTFHSGEAKILEELKRSITRYTPQSVLESTCLIFVHLLA